MIQQRRLSQNAVVTPGDNGRARAGSIARAQTVKGVVRNKGKSILYLTLGVAKMYEHTKETLLLKHLLECRKDAIAKDARKFGDFHSEMLRPNGEVNLFGGFYDSDRICYVNEDLELKKATLNSDDVPVWESFDNAINVPQRTKKVQILGPDYVVLMTDNLLQIYDLFDGKKIYIR